MKEINWCARRDSNSRPTAPEAAALSRLSYGRTADSLSVHCRSRRLNGLADFRRRDAARRVSAVRWTGGDARCSTSTTDQPSTVAIEPRLRLFACKIFLRSRSDFGVTSANSSSAINSIACSRFRLR